MTVYTHYTANFRSLERAYMNERLALKFYYLHGKSDSVCMQNTLNNGSIKTIDFYLFFLLLIILSKTFCNIMFLSEIT